ncbi:MAG TPA: adenylyl-sulfate kinase [Solimonas sp.]|nr:adenylyl-sulfate kinase [Solimonas sp.]
MSDTTATRGFTLFLTGLSGAGKSTLAEALKAEIESRRGRAVTLLDGDVVREMLSSGLTFSRSDRELNIRRIGYVAAEVVRHGGVCVCAVIAPFASSRDEARQRISDYGRFYEVYVSTPLEVCETRDPKGLYRRARRGELKSFTGIDDPFEAPRKPDLALDTSRIGVAESVRRVLALPERDGLL